MSISWISTDERILGLEDDIADVFAISAASTRGGGQVVVFNGQFLRSPEMVYDQVADRFRARGFVPLLRKEGGEDVLLAYPAPAIAGQTRLSVVVGLFVATVLSTLLVGTYQAVLSDDALARQFTALGGLGGALGFLAAHWAMGLPFAAALLGILGVHEFGHYFVARRYKLDVTLPYFIPFPFNMLTGTLGAVIRIRSPFESRKALFDVGIAGPLAGLAVAIPVTALGLARAEAVAVSPGHAFIFNEPLLFQWMARAIYGVRTPGTDILMNPLLMAGWWGFFITALNLVPLSQLDGGHIAYALFGRHHRIVAWATFAAAAVVALRVTPGFVLMLALVFMMGIEHPPALNDLTPIGTARKALGIATLILFLMLVTVRPFGSI